MKYRIYFQDYVIGDLTWRVGVVGGRICMVLPLGMGRAADVAMRRFADFEHVAGATSASEAMAGELGAFLEGGLRAFQTEPLLVGSDFEKRVWSELRRVGFGQRVSYGELARRCGCPGASRAVGGAVGRNPLLLIVPCHRVVASDGGLGGFSAGIDLKKRLLGLEEVETMNQGDYL